MSIVATEFPQQNLGIDNFLFTCIVVPTPQHGNEIPTSLCRNFIPTSLSGNEIPTKWHGNEIPTNCLYELYTIYNPATRRQVGACQALKLMQGHREELVWFLGEACQPGGLSRILNYYPELE